jgi:phytoene dehydrogenase-like protein
MMSAPYDTIVIGAGMSGLAAGIRLAQYDQRVVVLDRHSLWGGLNSFYKLKGHRFDVGLHALTNYVPKGTKGNRPLARILRQLRIPHEALKLGQQKGSRVSFPGVSLRWTNEFEVLRAEVADRFPRAIDGFDRLVRDIEQYPDLVESTSAPRMARAALNEYLGDPLLVDMLLLPLLYYGSPTPHDVEWNSFVILFKSLYEEGFARPEGGVRTILDLLRNRFKELGGELRMNSGVARVLHGTQGTKNVVQGVVLDDGTELRARTVLSSAGYVETLRMCEHDVAATVNDSDIGPLTFVEFLSVLDRRPTEVGHDDTIVFFNTEERLVYASPEDSSVDLRSGVICCPDNYAAAVPPKDALFRLTLLASHGVWAKLDEDSYQREKLRVHDAALDVASRFAFDPRPYTTYVDGFTPRTIQKFTGHLGGAVYGTPQKQLSGRTPVDGLFLCGTDQGYLGIVGAMLSGIAMANQHALQPA